MDHFCSEGHLCSCCEEIQVLRSGEMQAWAPLVLGWALAYFSTQAIAGTPPNQVDVAAMLEQMNEDLFS